MKPKQNTQWAPGTRPQRMNREDGQWEYEMEQINKRVKEREDEAKAIPVDCGIRFGDMVICCGDVVFAGEVDPMGKWVKIHGHKVGRELCHVTPDYFNEAYAKAIEEIYGTQQ